MARTVKAGWRFDGPSGSRKVVGGWSRYRPHQRHWQALEDLIGFSAVYETATLWCRDWEFMAARS